MILSLGMAASGNTPTHVGKTEPEHDKGKPQ